MPHRESLWRKKVKSLARELVEHGATPLSARTDRIIALIGAGASAPAGIPTAGKLKDVIKSVIKGNKHHISEAVLEEQLRYKGKGSIQAATLEDFTQAACSIAHIRDLVVEQVALSCLCPPKLSTHHAPAKSLPALLGYEIIAHLVKHGFIDHVISMNFDEILDQALENELGGALLKIVSERDAMMAKSPPAWMSCLVKPHGTISAPYSLRFTREDVKMFPNEIKDFIVRELLPPKSSPNDVPVTLIIVGCSMRDEVLAEILGDANIKHSYRIDTVKPRLLQSAGSIQPRGLAEVLGRRKPKEQLIVSPRGVEVLTDLWDLMQREAQKKNLTLVSIARHHILSEAFGRIRKGDGGIAMVDSEKRLELELLLAVAKAKGKFNTYNLARSGRVHRYFDVEHNRTSNVGVFKRMVEQPDGIFVNEHLDHRYEGENFLTYNFEDAKRYLWRFCEKNGVEPKARHRMLRWYRAVKDDEEVEVNRAPDARNEWQFEAAQPIHTMAELHQRTRKLLLNREANRLLLICESGDWLKREWVQGIISERIRSRAPQLDCELIIIQQDEIAPLAKGGLMDKRDFAVRPVVGSESHPNPIRLHWWEHNRHMTLAVRMSSDGKILKLVEGIYFRRRLNRPLIAPVHVNTLSDLDKLLRIFYRYRQKYFRSVIRFVPADQSHHREIDEVLRGAYRGQRTGRREASERIQRALTDPEQTTLLAYRDGESREASIVGVVSFLQKKNMVELIAVGVSKEWQQNGVGRMLIEKMEQVARINHTPLIQTVTDHDSIKDYLKRRGYEVSRNLGRGKFAMRKTIRM